VQQGGIVGPAAAPTLDATDYAALKALLSLPLVLLGWWPFGQQKRKTK